MASGRWGPSLRCYSSTSTRTPRVRGLGPTLLKVCPGAVVPQESWLGGLGWQGCLPL